MRPRLPLSSSRGFSLVSVLIGLCTISIVTLGVVTWNQQKRKLSRDMNVQAVADQITMKLKGALISPESWAKTFSSNHIGATGTMNLPLDIYILDGNDASTATKPFYRAGDSAAGFDIRGNPCQSFEAKTGNDACPFHYDISLISHTSQNGNWIDKIHFGLTYKPKSLNGAVLNTAAAKYNFDFTRNWDDRSVEKSCISVNGTYDIPSGKCTVKLTTPVDCNPSAAGTAYKGPNGGTNTANCETLRAPATACGTNMAIAGFSAQGAPICVNL